LKFYNNTCSDANCCKKISRGGQYTIVWDKTIGAEFLSKYHTTGNVLLQNVIVHNVNDKKEFLVVDYPLINILISSELQMPNATIVKNKNSGKFNIII
jgi:hypothetical protein